MNESVDFRNEGGVDVGGTWHFFEPDMNDVNQNPNHGEHFGAGTERDLPEILVREALQNSLDVAIAGQQTPIRVEFKLGRIDDPAGASTAPWFNDLFPHLDGAHPLVLTAPDRAKPMHYLVVEDFGTQGLTGDETANCVLSSEDAKGNNFYYFWRNIGISGKGDDNKGRWGLGKAVFYRASRINSYFGLTHRHDDSGRLLLMGITFPGVHHTADGSAWRAHGYWGAKSASGLIVPDDNVESAGKLMQAFGLQRGAHTGLSIIVPWLDRDDEAAADADDWSARSLAGAVINQFYLPILQGQLIVKVTENDGAVIKINADTLDSLVEQLDEACLREKQDVVARNVQLARTWITADKSLFRELPAFGDGSPNWKSWDLDEFMEPLRETFEETGQVLFRVPLTVHKKGTRASSHFDVLLEKDEDRVRGVADFFRAGLKVPKALNGRMSKVRALVLIPAGAHGALATMLGDAENPAHTIWDAKRAQKHGYDKYTQATITLVRRAPVELHQRLVAGSSKPDRKALKDVFSLKLVQPEKPNSEAKRPPKGAEIKPNAANTPWTVTRSTDGFSVTSTPGAPAARIAVGYAKPRGNPFKAPREGRPADFDVRAPEAWGIALASSNADMHSISANELVLRAHEPDTPWSFVISGFDPHRDLAVRIDPVDEVDQ